MAATVIAVSAGKIHGLALKSDGTVVGWGDDAYGKATPPPGLTGVIAISAGYDHSLALKSDGTVVGWGRNNYGQRVPPGGLVDAIAISAANIHSLALKSDGTVVGWGSNVYNQADPPGGLTDVVAISAANAHSLALKSDGTVVGWGNGTYGSETPPTGLTDVIAIAAAAAHSHALKSDGAVVSWGSGNGGLAEPPVGLSDVSAISTFFGHSLALKADGSVVGWGDNPYGSATPPVGLTDATAIDAGVEFSLAIRSDGSVVGWGKDNAGQATPPKELQAITRLEINATLPFFAVFDSAAEISINGRLGFQSSLSGFQDWVSGMPPIQLQEVYRLIITGAPDGESDMSIGAISSWQATSQASPRSAYLQAVIPAADSLLQGMSDRKNGELVLQKGYRMAGGEVRYSEIIRTRFDEIRPDRGRRAMTITVSGYRPGNSPSNGSRPLTGVRSISSQNGKRRVRCDIDLFLQPGMTAHALGESFRADYINYYVSQADKFCEVSER